MGKTVKLLFQLRLFVDEIGHIVAQGSIQHNDNHILTGLAQTEVGGFLGVHLRHIGLDLVGALNDLDAVPAGHTNSTHNGDGQNGSHNLLLLGGQPPDANKHHRNRSQVNKLFHTGIEEALIILQVGGNQAQIPAEEHKVHHSGDGGNSSQTGKDHLALVACQPVEHGQPH